jgi:hypothetical protein
MSDIKCFKNKQDVHADFTASTLPPRLLFQLQNGSRNRRLRTLWTNQAAREQNVPELENCPFVSWFGTCHKRLRRTLMQG